jgi:Uma2 family endonuclease
VDADDEAVKMVLSTPPEIIYPEDDGLPMSENTKQFRWIVTIKENLELLFADNPNVFVAGDLLWYPVEGNNKIAYAPDVMVVLGRSKGDRGSYQQWKEDNIAPQVVFEILSPSNRLAEMMRKLDFYQQYGVEEYYIYDPDRVDFTAWTRSNVNVGDSLPLGTASSLANRLVLADKSEEWTSERLGVRFVMAPDLVIYHPNGEPFLSLTELNERRRSAEQRADSAERRADSAEQRAERLAAKLRELGIEPDTIDS